MHASTKNIGDDQAEQLRDGRILRLERVDRCQHRREGAQTDPQEDRPKGANGKLGVVLSGQNLAEHVSEA